MLRELAQMVASGEVSAADLVSRAYERIGMLNSELNAVVALRDPAQALEEARAVDERIRDVRWSGPLAGMPFLVKDDQDIAGMRTTHGSLLQAAAPPATRDALIVARLRSAGAIPVGKSNVPEHSFEGYTANRLFGATRNPWAPGWTPGGSSGGSAAALAAGMVPIATASDAGGSIRVPAAFCGLYGFKPTNGLVARDPMSTWIDFGTVGPLALSMGDVRLLLAVEAGPAPGDPTALPSACVARLLGLASKGAPRDECAPRPSVVLAAPRLVDRGPLPNAIADLFDVALTSLEKELGLPVEPIAATQILGGGHADRDWFLISACEQAHALGRETVEANADRLHPAFLAAMRRGLEVRVDEYLAARRRRSAYCRALDRLLGSDRVLVTPTMATVGFLEDGREVGAKSPGTQSASYNTQVQNMTGHPALSVPAGRSPNGVPFGLQITGPRFADALVLALGDVWERMHPEAGVAPGFRGFEAG